MKIIHAVLLVLGLLPGIASARDLTDEDRRTEQVYEIPDQTRDQLYTGARTWIAENFKSAKAVIEYESREEGTIIGNGVMQYPCKGLACMIKSDWTVPFTMRVDTKDGKFRLTFTNIHLAWPASFSAGIASPAADIPVRKQADMDLIRPKLLAMGEQIKSKIESGKVSNDW